MLFGHKGEAPYTWEQAVRWMRAQPEMARVVHESYLGQDVVAEAERYATSDEFNEVLRILKRYVRTQDKKFVDLGCGNGIASYALGANGFRILAVDPDLSDTVGIGATAGLARSGGLTGRVWPVAGTSERLPIRSRSVEAIFARQVLHHFESLVAGLAECWRVLVPGGILVACREHVADDQEQLEAFLAAHPLHWLYGKENAYPLQAYLDAADEAGFETVRVLGPYDTPINYYPRTCEDIHSEAVRNLSRKTGKRLAAVALRLKPVRAWYSRRMSHFDRTPGRLFSFVLRKPR